MVLLRVNAGPLVPRLRSELAALLTSLTATGRSRRPARAGPFMTSPRTCSELSSATSQCGATAGGPALKRYARDPSAPPLTWQGDRELADALAGVQAVLG